MQYAEESIFSFANQKYVPGYEVPSQIPYHNKCQVNMNKSQVKSVSVSK